MKLIRKICLIILIVIGCFFIGYAIGKHFESIKMKKIVYVDFISEEIETQQENIHKYKFLPAELSDYIVRMCTELEIDPDLAVAILMQENPEINLDAIHRNENGTMDLGLWQLNDKYLYTTFANNFWKFEEVELNAFDWKHNTFVALHQIEWLQSRLKLFDDIVMGYNAGISAVMNRTIPDSTKIYLCRVKNNFNLLKGMEK
jgi:hypothetical protein